MALRAVHRGLRWRSSSRHTWPLGVSIDRESHEKHHCCAATQTPARQLASWSSGRVPTDLWHPQGLSRYQAELVPGYYRQLHTAAARYQALSNDERRKLIVEIDAQESKVEQSLKQLLTQKLKEQKNPSYQFVIDKRAHDALRKQQEVAQAPWYQRLHTKQFWIESWGKAKHEFQHYKAGFQLLWADMKIAGRLMGKVVRGHPLTRRERRQLVRTMSDLFRLLPFSVFIIVPGMEFTLPFFIRIFPGMLPSQFQDAKSKEDRLKAQLKVRLDVAKFLQETAEDMAVKRKKAAGDDDQPTLHQEFGQFLAKYRDKGYVSTQEILRFAPLFRDEMTLDSMDLPQLKAMCKLLSLEPVGNSTILRFRLRLRLQQIRADDQDIAREGIENLSILELQAACRERGMRAIGISEASLRDRLQQWLDLHIKHNVPVTLLLMSRVLYLPENVPEFERVRAVVEGLPQALLEQVKVEVLEAEGFDVDAKLRLQIIALEEAKIQLENDERKREEERKKSEQVTDSTAKDKDKDKEKGQEKEKEEKSAQAPQQAASGSTPSTAEQSKMAKASAQDRELRDDAPVMDASAPSDVDLSQAVPSTSSSATSTPTPAASGETAKPAKGEKRKAEPLTLADCVDLALVVSRMSGHKDVSTEFLKLKEEVEEHREDVADLQSQSQDELAVLPVSQTLSARVERMLSNVEASMEKIDSANLAELDLDRDGIISREELLYAMRNMKNSPSEEKMALLADALDADHDGKLRLDVLQKVLNLIAYEGVDIRSDHLRTLTSLVERVNAVEGAEASKKA